MWFLLEPDGDDVSPLLSLRASNRKEHRRERYTFISEIEEGEREESIHTPSVPEWAAAERPHAE
jgi:hypothetical protein